jgi:hypothetical protein
MQRHVDTAKNVDDNDLSSPSVEWRESLNATCNRLSTQYLNLIKAASSVMALQQQQLQSGNTSSSKMNPRSGGHSRMQGLQDPPPPPLAADIASSSLQCQLAVENIAVAASQLLSLIRTLRLSVLLMDETTIQAEEEWQVAQLQESALFWQQQAHHYEQQWMTLRNNINIP